MRRITVGFLFSGSTFSGSQPSSPNAAGSSRQRWKICHWLYPVDCRQLVPCNSDAAAAPVGGGDGILTAHNCHNKTVPANISSTHRFHPGDGNAGAKCNYKAEKVSKSILLFLGGVCQQGNLANGVFLPRMCLFYCCYRSWVLLNSFCFLLVWYLAGRDVRDLNIYTQFVDIVLTLEFGVMNWKHTLELLPCFWLWLRHFW